MTEVSRTKGKFTHEDDEKLMDIVEEVGEDDWVKVAQLMGNKNARQCHDRWSKYLNPEVNLSPFTLEEDILLLTVYKNIGPKWVAILKYFKNRSDVCVKSRYRVLKRRRITLDLLKKYPNMQRRKKQRQHDHIIRKKAPEPKEEDLIDELFNLLNFDEKQFMFVDNLGF